MDNPEECNCCNNYYPREMMATLRNPENTLRIYVCRKCLMEMVEEIDRNL